MNKHDIRTLNVTLNDENIPVIFIGEVNPDTHNDICDHISQFYPSAITERAVSDTFKDYSNTKYAIISFDLNDDNACEKVKDISAQLKQDNICVVGASLNKASTYEDEKGNPIDPPQPETTHKDVIDSMDVLVLVPVEVYYDEDEDYFWLISSMVTTLLDIYIHSADKDKTIFSIKNSGVAYFVTDENISCYSTSDLIESSLFKAMFSCPFYAASNVFCDILHGTEFKTGCEFYGDLTDEEIVVSLLADHCDNNADICIISNNEIDDAPYYVSVNCIFFGFNGKSSVFNDKNMRLYPEKSESKLARRIHILLNKPFLVTTKRKELRKYMAKE